MIIINIKIINEIFDSFFIPSLQNPVTSICIQYELAIFQELNSHRWLVASLLTSRLQNEWDSRQVLFV